MKTEDEKYIELLSAICSGDCYTARHAAARALVESFGNSSSTEQHAIYETILEIARTAVWFDQNQ